MNHRRMYFGLALLAALVSLTTASLAVAQTLQVYAGAIAEPSEDLPWTLPELALDPPFERDVKAYSLRIPHTTTGISLATDEFHGFTVAVGESVDGSDLSTAGWRFRRRERGMSHGGILSVDNLGVGGNTIRIGLGINAGRFDDDDIYTIVASRAAEVSSAAEVTALNQSLGELRPAFATGTAACEAVVPGGVIDLEISATASLGGRVAITGQTSDGSALAVNSTRVSGLAVGRNTITIGVTSEDGAAYGEYSVVVHRDSPAGSVTLQDLQFSEGPPEPGFMASVMSGTLPEGIADPTPACTLGVPLSYTLDVLGSLMTIRARAAAGAKLRRQRRRGGRVCAGDRQPVIHHERRRRIPQRDPGQSQGGHEHDHADGQQRGRDGCADHHERGRDTHGGERRMDQKNVEGGVQVRRPVSLVVSRTIRFPGRLARLVPVPPAQGAFQGVMHMYRTLTVVIVISLLMPFAAEAQQRSTGRRNLLLAGLGAIGSGALLIAIGQECQLDGPRTDSGVTLFGRRPVSITYDAVTVDGDCQVRITNSLGNVAHSIISQRVSNSESTSAVAITKQPQTNIGMALMGTGLLMMWLSMRGDPPDENNDTGMVLDVAQSGIFVGRRIGW